MLPEKLFGLRCSDLLLAGPLRMGATTTTFRDSAPRWVSIRRIFTDTGIPVYFALPPHPSEESPHFFSVRDQIEAEAVKRGVWWCPRLEIDRFCPLAEEGEHGSSGSGSGLKK